MIRIGDRVHHILNMKKVGIVLNILFEGAEVHLEGGTAQRKMILVVRFDDGSIMGIPRDDLLKAD